MLLAAHHYAGYTPLLHLVSQLLLFSNSHETSSPAALMHLAGQWRGRDCAIVLLEPSLASILCIRSMSYKVRALAS